MQTLLQILRCVVLVVLEAAALLLLVRLGDRAPFSIPTHHLQAWLRDADPAEVAAPMVRLFALAAVAWLLTTTVLYTAARALQARKMLRRVTWATLPSVRWIVDGALVLVTAGALASPAMAAAALPPAPVRDGHTSTATSGPIRSGVDSAPVSGPNAEPDTTTSTRAAAPAPVRTPLAAPRGADAARPLDQPSEGAGTGGSGDRVETIGANGTNSARGTGETGGTREVHETVEPAETRTPPTLAAPTVPAGTLPVGAAVRPAGEHDAALPLDSSGVRVAAGDTLWSISATTLAAATGRDPALLDDHEVAGYWIRVCNANRGRLRSGDLNLIYPGEVVALPPAG